MATKIKKYINALPEVVLDYPFGPEVEVYKVCDKMFALYTLAKAQLGQLNLKCDPNEALFLRDYFPAVTPGYHMNKKHWNTVVLDGSVPERELQRMIDNSYKLVVAGLPKARRTGLQLRNAEAEIFLR